MSENRDPEEILQDAIGVKDFLSSCGLSATITVPSDDEEVFTVNQFTGVEVVGKMKSQVFSLLEENMQELYLSSGWGWNEESKRKELFHALSRFLILLDSKNRVAAFVMFRFEWDDEDEPEYPVLFLYEIQVHEDHRGKNLGTTLLNYIKSIAAHTQTSKILLTCFKANTKALQFYYKNGFGIDANSPSACGFADESYELLSDKPVRRNT